MKLQLASLAAGLLLLAGCAGPAQPQSPPASSPVPSSSIPASSSPAPEPASSLPSSAPDSSQPEHTASPISTAICFRNDPDNWTYTHQEYADLAAILTDCGFDAQAQPEFTYSDGEGRLQMELYLDTEQDIFCGVRYEWPEEGEAVPYGFIGDIANEPQWSPEQPVDVADASDGHLISNQVYDGDGRLVYCTSYITHGHLEHYYSYSGSETAPRYYLILDDNMGSYDPSLSCLP